MPKLRYSERWSGAYRGVGLEVRRTDRPEVEGLSRAYDLWTYYIYLHEKQVPEEKRARFFLEPKIKQMPASGRDWLTYDYYKSALVDLPWHCGITYYGYKCAVPGFRIICAGCDYNHDGDDAESNPFSREYVEYDVRKTVNALWEQHPDLLVRCGYNGEYYPLSEVEPWGEGWISAEGKAKRDGAALEESDA